MTKVLQGVRVVEHGTFITGPAAPPLLGEHNEDFRDGWDSASPTSSRDDHR